MVHLPPHSLRHAWTRTALLILLSYGCQSVPDIESLSEPRVPVRFGDDTREAIALKGPVRVRAHAGTEVLLALGNPGEKETAVAVTGLAQETWIVDPGSWLEARGTALQDELVVDPSDAGILLAAPYLVPEQAKPLPNLLLISVDTLRRDHFTPELMPRTYRLFDKGARFERAYSTAPWTIPAHASLFTGLYPAFHGLREPSQKLAPTLTTLAEVLSQAGYYSLAATEENYLSSTFGFEQGFHLFHEDGPDLMKADRAEASRLEVNLDFLKRRLAELKDVPIFAFLHTFEVHCPYLPTETTADPEGMGQTAWLLEHDGARLEEDVLSRLKELYAGEVSYTDRLLAAFVEPLIGEGNWIVVLLSDHGEEFGEHGGLLHSSTVYEEVMRIPLALIGPGVPARTDTEARSIVDVPRTVVRLLGIEPPSAWQGRDLFQEPAQPRLFGESFFFGDHKNQGGASISSVWHENRKLIRQVTPADSITEVYDLLEDPMETSNLGEKRLKDRIVLNGMLQKYLAAQGAESPPAGKLTADQLESLKALGYIQ